MHAHMQSGEGAQQRELEQEEDAAESLRWKTRRK